MTKRIAIALLCVAGLAAAPVTISDTISTPMGGKFSGRVIVSLAGQTSQPLYNSDGVTLSGWVQTYQVTEGVFSATLESNAAITPAGTSYRAQFLPSNGGQPWSEVWYVPSSATALKVAAIRAATVPTPTVMVQPSQITQAAATTGQCLKWSGTAWVPGTCGGGGSGLTWAELDGITWSELQ